jgi:hypothetical protein
MQMLAKRGLLNSAGVARGKLPVHRPNAVEADSPSAPRKERVSDSTPSRKILFSPGTARRGLTN